MLTGGVQSGESALRPGNATTSPSLSFPTCTLATMKSVVPVFLGRTNTMNKFRAEKRVGLNDPVLPLWLLTAIRVTHR